jgi:hypothetical protein
MDNGCMTAIVIFLVVTFTAASFDLWKPWHWRPKR